MQVGLGADTRLVDRETALETIEPERARHMVAFALGDQMREAEAGGRRRLEAAIAPAAVEIEVRRRACGR
jgi:hypothetical protein